MKKKKIEDIFSSIENFSSVPPPELWTMIEEKLDEPKKKKVTAIWWSLAASLLIGLAITSGLYFNSNEDETLIKNKNVVLDNQKSNSKSNTTPSTINTTTLDSKTPITVAESNNSATNKISTNNQESPQTAIISVNKKEKSSLKLNHGTISIAISSSKNNTTTTSSEYNSPKTGNSINKDKSEKIALNNNIQSASQNDTKSSLFNQNTTGVTSILKIDPKEEIALNSSSDKDLISFNDSLNKVQIALELQQLENRLNNKEDKEEPKIEKDLLKEKWSVGLYAGVANSQSYGNKKTLGNDIESKQNTGYGVKTNYKLNKKWAISSGFKINELGQSVANVSYYNKKQNTLAAGITNDFFASNPSVEYISTNKNYVFSSDNSNQKVQSSGTSNLTGNIDQQLQYLEMPLEISYSILSTSKAAIMLNTGGFIGKLISNEIFLDGNSIGGNLDVNNFVYGSKLSSTLQYEVLKQTRLFVEPGLNYYINPLKTQSFNQFQWGLNFGVNFGF
ncbi:hypothetical protein IUY40_02290 [Flavobacterium sp. ALJ2]|uniref:hypothetical protein n=1 Tax=Flavobacterium sp. ALJ2 TaxID=2786960 RepID=UPI00189F1A0B|nr:hypothetical protein [Flavobacterium sp. ALJ2]MBF7090374.1 hypothetical protein [Flavobacterium sp. ALJ2]